MSSMNSAPAKGGRAFLSGVDFYRHVPRDLTQATKLGAIMSILAIVTMTVLFFAETLAFARTSIVTEISLDDNTTPQIRLNFNITFFDLQCDYATVDVLDALGSNRQNVTKNVEKWQLDNKGVRRVFSGRNREAREVTHEKHDQTLEEMHEDGVHAKVLTKDTWKSFLDQNEIAFVNFYAPWCVWCQRLHPTWEKFAEEVEKENMPVGVGVVNCVAEAQLCRDQRVKAFPTLQWFQNGEVDGPDYMMDRTVASLKGYSYNKFERNEKFKNWKNDKSGVKRPPRSLQAPILTGCQVSGHLMVNRVPGNFHIEARSKSHNLNAAMTNLTHRVNHLSFGDPLGKNKKANRILKQVPDEYKKFNPIDGNVYASKDFHEAYHHSIKVVTTRMEMGSSSSDKHNSVVAYQFLEQSQLVFYDEIDVPEARFSYDISPMGVVVQKKGRKWYDYLTSLCAIIGGTFTTLGLIDASLYKVFKSKKID